MTRVERFTPENTSGYSQSQLDALNATFRDRMQRYYPHVRAQKSTADYVAEQTLADFDAGRQ